ncbi:unnamed protein product, partial [Sphagnum balticum]
MAEKSLRTLCLAYKKLQAHDDLESKDARGVFESEKTNLVLIAVLGVQDIPRKEVPDAIRKCHKAGITVRMVTGDNIITAKAIAKEIGIISDTSDSLVMEGPEFSKLVGGIVCKKCRTALCPCPKDSKTAEEEGVEVRVDTVALAEEFDKIQDKLLVLARSRPEDKYLLVTGLKERGNVVAVTGDGTNDAPALKKADVGFAMGMSGTEVAREAAAIILVDDNFNSIVKAVLWGRNIYDSIRKFIQFQLTVNVVAFIPEYVDHYDSTVFAGRPGDKWLNGIVGGTVRSGRMYTIAGDNDYYPIFQADNIYSRHFTFIFNTFVMMQIFNFLNARKLHEEVKYLLFITFTGLAFGVYGNFGLTIQQWLIS